MHLLKRLCFAFFLTLTLAAPAWRVSAQDASASEAPPAAPTPEPVIQLDDEILRALNPSRHFQLGIEAAAYGNFHDLKSKRVGVITNKEAVDQHGRHIITYFTEAKEFSLNAIFLIDDGSGIRNRQIDQALRDHRDVKVFELNRERFRPTEGMLRDVDAVVFDAPLPGPRFALETAVLGAALEQSSLLKKRFVVLDRPLICNNLLIEGPTTDLQTFGSLEAFLPVPTFPGMTAGELARLFNGYFGIQADLRVISMRNWKRSHQYEAIFQAPAVQLTEQQAERLGELNSQDSYRPGFVELHAASLLAGDEGWELQQILAPEQGPVELVLVAKEKTPRELLAGLENLPIRGLEPEVRPVTLMGSEMPALALKAAEPLEIKPVELSLTLKHLVLEPDSVIETPENAGLYGASWIYEALRRRFPPKEIVIRWESSDAYQNFLRQRNEVMLYTP